MNDVLQWACLAMLGLLVLGLYRQVAVTRPPALRSASDAIVVGRQVPRALLDAVANGVPQLKASGATLLAFVSEGCAGCQRLLADLPKALADVKVPTALVVRRPSVSFADALSALPVAVLMDADGSIWSECRVTATPLVVLIDADGDVLRREVTHDVRRVAQASV